MYKILLLSISILIFSGCLSTEINIATYKQSINIKENIPQVCKSNFKQTKPTVAVVNFTNNSTFGTAKISTNNSDASIGLFGFSLGASSNKTNTIKTVEPKLAKAFIPLIEKMILDTGGTELFTRTDLDKVDTELKLQDSGLLDPSSIVEFGLNSGVEYIITGSIDYVEHNFKNYSKTTGTLANATYNTDNTNLKLAATGLHFISSLFDGTTVKTAITVKIIDVSTGKIIFSQQIKKDTKINSKNKPSYDQLVGAVKNCISEALPILQDKFQDKFSLKGYITKLKKDGNDIIAQINLGKKDNIKKGQIFIIQSMNEDIDPLTNTTSCELLDTNTKLTVTKYISKDKSWLKVENPNNSQIKLLQLVKKIK